MEKIKYNTKTKVVLASLALILFFPSMVFASYNVSPTIDSVSTIIIVDFLSGATETLDAVTVFDGGGNNIAHSSYFTGGTGINKSLQDIGISSLPPGTYHLLPWNKDYTVAYGGGETDCTTGNESTCTSSGAFASAVSITISSGFKSQWTGSFGSGSYDGFYVIAGFWTFLLVFFALIFYYRTWTKPL